MKLIQTFILVFTSLLFSYSAFADNLLPFTVFTVTRHGLEPVAVWKEDKFVSPPLLSYGENAKESQVLVKKFAIRVIKSSKTLPIYRHGQHLGVFLPQEYLNRGCSDFGQVIGQLKLKDQSLELQTFIGFSSGFPGRKFYRQKSQSVIPIDKVENLLKGIFIKNGIEQSLLKTFKIERLEPFSPGFDIQAISLVASVKQETKNCTGCKHTLWVIAELANQGYTPKIVKFQNYDTSSKQSIPPDSDYQLISTFSTDQTPNKFLVQVNGYEAWHYEIYQRADSQYEKIYTGSGGGC